MASQRKNMKKFMLDEVDELKFIVIIAKPQLEKSITTRLESLGGRVILKKAGKGIGKKIGLEMLEISPSENIVIFACARKEDADNIVVAIDSEVNFSEPGVGLGFTLDIEGYCGARGLFI